MRKARFLPEGQHITHCLSRVVDRQFILNDLEKRHFLKLMRGLEAFSGIRVLTYCIMSNHFHLLLDTPERGSVLPQNDQQLLKRVAALYGRDYARKIERELEDCIKDGRTRRADQIRKSFTDRMGDLSRFMKDLKQRFTQWYNGRNDRKGTLWEDRFKSVIVENTHEALLAISAYIDLNPVRAGLVDDPKDYRWSGYGEAVAGGGKARSGLGGALDAERVARGYRPQWKTISREYRRLLYGVGEERVTADGERIRKGISSRQVGKAESRRHRLTLSEALRCRVRYFSDGTAIGTKEFLENLFQSKRDHFGANRQTGARKMGHADWKGLCSMRDLRANAVVRSLATGPPQKEASPDSSTKKPWR